MGMQQTPTRYIMRRNRHKQGTMEWQGEKIKVDEGIQPLLKALNRFPHIATTSSCIGYPGERGFAGFSGDNVEDVKEFFELLSLELIDFDVRIELNQFVDGTSQGCLRWHPEDLNAIVEALEIVLEQKEEAI